MKATGGALQGLRVVDLSRVLAGPYCAQMLGDHGADVVKVETPGGEETRRWGPPFVAPDMSSYYAGLNRSKRNLSLNLATARGREILRLLLEGADVLVENFKIGTLAKWGLPDETIASSFAGLVHCRITGFGSDGPMSKMPGYDAVLQAYSGLMSVNGEASAPPLRVGVPIVDITTAIFAYSGILLALNERARSGRGQLVNCSLLDTAVSLLHPHAAAWFASGEHPRRTGSAHSTVAPYDNYSTRTGLIFIGAGSDLQFQILLDVLSLSELAGDARFSSNALRQQNRDELREILSERLAARDGEQVSLELLERGVPSSPVYEIPQALNTQQVAHEEMVIRLSGTYTGLGVPVKLGRTPGHAGLAPRQCGEDTTEILTEIGLDPAEIAELRRSGVV
jgi:crotonobetainyl-CoA:carnitine CoA-transferase CaiB-like acyl-CoA transferase